MRTERKKLGRSYNWRELLGTSGEDERGGQGGEERMRRRSRQRIREGGY